jgi:hypothetical protein
VLDQWKDMKYGSTMYRLNDAAMQIDHGADGSLLFKCSDGWGQPDFGDLIFEVRMDRHAS